MKLLGAALILSGSTFACAHYLAAGRRERQALRELSAALELLAHGVRTSLLPLPRLLERRGGGTFADEFFARVLAERTHGTPLDKSWRDAAETLPLQPRECETLARAADAFGENEEGVVAVLLDCAHALRAESLARESAAQQSRRLTLALSLGGSTLLVVMLL